MPGVSVNQRRLVAATWLLGLLASNGSAQADLARKAGPALPTEPSAAAAAIISRYCVDCHDGKEPSGGVNLAGPLTAGRVIRDARDWNKAIRVARYHEMPPPDADQPTAAERKQLTIWLNETLAKTASSPSPDPGAATIRRLNRFELKNTLFDLLGVEGDLTRDLPTDPPAYGFDNVGDALFTTPELLEKYVDLARVVAEQVLANPALRERLCWTKPLAGREAIAAALTPVLRRAFRRPPTAPEIASRVALVERTGAKGDSRDLGLRLALESILVSPHFLFRVEADQAPAGSNKPYRVTDHELATRLSYFLWSTQPDGELDRLADQHKLRDATTLRAQVSRMLASPKADALATHFVAQWLRIREILTLGVDYRSYPPFNDTVRADYYEESIRFVMGLVREDRSVLEIIDADYAHLNERLARFYGIETVKGNEWRKAPLPDRRRGGILGMGSVLTVTSYPTRTSPVIRGKWVLEELLGSPPPPPPPNIPSLARTADRSKPQTLRQRLELHRAQESCASCHRKMDPIGFALENFDGIGQWREKDGDLPIDTTGELSDGAKVNGPAALKAALLERKELFVRTMLEKMLIYALGRPIESTDEGTVRQILASLEKDGYRTVTMVEQVIASYPFQHRRNAQEEAKP